MAGESLIASGVNYTFYKTHLFARLIQARKHCFPGVKDTKFHEFPGDQKY
jgi:hypothetical protein